MSFVFWIGLCIFCDFKSLICFYLSKRACLIFCLEPSLYAISILMLFISALRAFVNCYKSPFYFCKRFAYFWMWLNLVPTASRFFSFSANLLLTALRLFFSSPVWLFKSSNFFCFCAISPSNFLTLWFILFTYASYELFCA